MILRIQSVTEEVFEQYLHQISDKISHNAKRDGIFEEYKGPQCYEDRLVPERLNYDFKYRATKAYDPIPLPQDLPNQNSVYRDTSELKETVYNCSFSLRRCYDCNHIRLLGNRAAMKYPLGWYHYERSEKRLPMLCENLYKLSCDGVPDVDRLSTSDLEKDQPYIFYTEGENNCFWGYVLYLRSSNDEVNLKIEVVNYFGPRNCEFSDIST